MKLPLAALLSAIALCSCGGGSSTKPDPSPGDGKKVEEDPAKVDLEAECRGAAQKWKTLRATYKAEGATNVTVTVAYERGGRAALQIDPGQALVLDGGVLTIRGQDSSGASRVAAVPIGHLLAAAMAIRDGKPLPRAGENPVVPAGHVLTDLGLEVGEDGRARRKAVIAVSLAEATAFGWLALLHPREGFLVRAEERTAVVTGPCGRVAIDRDNGSLVDWILEPPGGHSARLRRESFATDEAPDAGLFRLEGEPAGAAETRGVVKQYLVSLALELVRTEPEWSRRIARMVDFARAYYRSAWTSAEIDRLAALGAARRHEIARELRAKNPDLPQADIDDAAFRSALPTIGEAVGTEVSEDEVFFLQLAQPPDDSRYTLQEFAQAFERMVTEELAQRALDAGKDK